MKVRGSGAWPENSAPEKSKPGFCKGGRKESGGEDRSENE